MKKEDRDFLEELQCQMLTQDSVGQASPRFWVVIETAKIYGIDKDYGCSGTDIVIDGDVIATNLQELYEYLSEHEDGNEELKIEYIKDALDHVVITNSLGDSEEFIIKEDLLEYMHEELDYDDESIYAADYKVEDRIVENTMFLTLKECEDHIKKNSYHYKDGRPYAMTAWRSPQVARLYDILENTDWDKVK